MAAGVAIQLVGGPAALYYGPVKACLFGKNSSDHRERVLAVVR